MRKPRTTSPLGSEGSEAAPTLTLGPESGSGSPADPSFYARVREAAARCGVTRLADITGLDRLSMPVWQAVRPAGRALSVHQGKGATELGARIGALCEAIESHCAEGVPADGPLCPIGAIEPSQAGATLSDYCRFRRLSPPVSQAVQWCRATDFLTGSPTYLPHDLVSLDFRGGRGSCFERSSNGLGAGASEADALRVSLLELIERDAEGRWQRAGGLDRRKRELEPATIGLDWFQHWRERFAGLGIELRVFGLPALARIPVFVCWITGREEFGTARRSFSGAAAHGSAEMALFKALAEALQSRLTHIAGVRDDILPSRYARLEAQLPLAIPPSDPAVGRRAWRPVEPAADAAEQLAMGLARVGYRRILFRRLDADLDGVAVTKAFVPGLGTLKRRRRRPE